MKDIYGLPQTNSWSESKSIEILYMRTNEDVKLSVSMTIIQRSFSIVPVLVFALYLSGCSSVIEYTGGVQAPYQLLDDKLILGESTHEDIQTVLGKPTGSGGVMLPIDPEAREVWSYYYEEGTMDASNSQHITAEALRTFLFVYFKEGKYDGYMWFSTFPKAAAPHND